MATSSQLYICSSLKKNLLQDGFIEVGTKMSFPIFAKTRISESTAKFCLSLVGFARGENGTGVTVWVEWVCVGHSGWEECGGCAVVKGVSGVCKVAAWFGCLRWVFGGVVWVGL
jgi:hypothetical protein